MTGLALARGYHGNAKTEEQRGQLPITAEDWARLPEIIGNFDTVEAVGEGGHGTPLIRYSKRFNGTTYYVEEVRGKRKELAAKTMWKTRTAMSGAGDSPALTSATLGRNLPSGMDSVALSRNLGLFFHSGGLVVGPRPGLLPILASGNAEDARPLTEAARRMKLLLRRAAEMTWGYPHAGIDRTPQGHLLTPRRSPSLQVGWALIPARTTLRVGSRV